MLYTHAPLLLLVKFAPDCRGLNNSIGSMLQTDGFIDADTAPSTLPPGASSSYAPLCLHPDYTPFRTVHVSKLFGCTTRHRERMLLLISSSWLHRQQYPEVDRNEVVSSYQATTNVPLTTVACGAWLYVPKQDDFLGLQHVASSVKT